MDRSTDGGMAPALQSSNHQSTGLTSEGEVDQAASELLHKKVNGKIYKVDSPSDETTTETGVTNITLHPTDTEVRTLDKINRDTELDSCFSTGLKKVAPEGIMPTLQMGQGDSVIGHIANYNGFGESKKAVFDGILQESNNLSAVWGGTKTSIPKISTRKAVDSEAITDISCNGDSENRRWDQSSVKSNGHAADQKTLLEESPSALFWDTSKETEASNTLPPTKTSVKKDNVRLETEDSEILSTEDKLSCKPQSVLPAGSSTSTLNSGKGEIHGALERSNTNCKQGMSLSEKCAENKIPIIESTTCSGSIRKPVNCQNSSNEHSLTHAPKSADSMFLYSQILPGDLTGMSMSDNLTNTLQELAASLKEASFPLQLDVNREIGSKEPCNTVNTDNVIDDTLHTLAESLDFREDNCTEREARVLHRTHHAAHCVGILEHRLGLLKQNLLKYRSKTLRNHIHKQFVAIANHLPKQDWESHPINVVDTDPTSTADLWHKVFENFPDAMSKSILDHMSTQELDARGRKLQPDSDHKTSPNRVEAVGDPTVQLPSLHSTKLPSTADLCQIAQEKAGLLKKELQYAKSCCDPEITESSSDEDLEEAYEDVYRKTKANFKANGKPRVTRYRKSFCRWVAERAEISRKWTWLQSRIAGMEFQIRNQGDLYNQLRSNKGMVRLVPEGRDNNDRVERSATDVDEANDSIYTTEAQTSSSSPPCSINHVLDNVNHQASRLIDTLSPVSGGWPSPVQEMKTSESNSYVPHVQSTVPSCHNVSSLEVEDQCARTIALDRVMFKTRKLVRINQKRLNGSTSLKPSTVPNDSSIMCPEQGQSRSRQNENFSSLVLKAAVHDHSYHATISSLKAVMKSKHQWSKKPDPNKNDKSKKATKKVKKSEKKLQRSLHANHLEEVVEKKRRRLTSQLSDVSSRKRTAGSIDSDLDSQVIIGGFNSHQFSQGSASGTTTPTSEMFASSQSNWKKKKLAEQTFDINNIVIPHGLNTSRIEKLVYKEIQTPSWKFLNVTNQEMSQESKDDLSVDKVENTSDVIFQNRHENYEVSEKKKFMSLVQSRRSRRGFRNSTARESATNDPASPMAVSGDNEAHSRIADALPTMPSQATSTMSPTANSGDHVTREQQPTSPHALPLSQRNLDISYNACPSPTATLCPSGSGSRRNSHDNPAHIQRTLSYNTNKFDEVICDGWEIRSFPLSDEDMKVLDDVEHAKTMLRGSNHNGTMYRSIDGEDTGRHSNCRTPNLERNLHESVKLGLTEVPRDIIKATARRRTDSRGSSMASFDDSARHSDASSTSVSSSRRKKGRWHGTSEASSQRNGTVSGKGSKKLTSRKSKHKYIHVRLSETDDSSTDSDGDSTDSSYTSDDAGHLLDDFADPEWEAPRPRERR